MYYFQVYSNNSLIYYSNKFVFFGESGESVELVNNTNFDFNYVDKFGYQVYLFKDSKLLNILF